MHMHRQNVKSSSIAAVSYSQAEELLEVEFVLGTAYQYRPVPPDLHAGFLTASSKGHYFNTNIRPHFSAKRVR